MPRFGSLDGLVLFPLNFLGLYLWKPAPRLLAAAAGMFLVVALISTAVIAWTETVTVVSSPLTDRLPSAYAWTCVPLLFTSAYIGRIAWVTRHHIPMHDASPKAD